LQVKIARRTIVGGVEWSSGGREQSTLNRTKQILQVQSAMKPRRQDFVSAVWRPTLMVRD
jgi:hypothetical protein